MGNNNADDWKDVPAKAGDADDWQDVGGFKPPAGPMDVLRNILPSPGQVGSGLAELATSLLVPEGKIARVAANTGGSSLAGYLKPADSQGGRLKNAYDSGKLALLLSGGGEALGGLSRNTANRAEMRAVGLVGNRRKGIPADVGNRLVEEGVWGTKAGMAKQVNTKYAAADKEVQNLADQLQGNVSGDVLAGRVENLGNKHRFSSTGQPIRGHGPEVEQIEQAGRDLRYRGDRLPEGTQAPVAGYSGRDLLELKKAGDWEGFTHSGSPATSTAAEIGRTQANAARSSLSDMSSGAMPEALKREQALLLADSGLHVPSPVYKNSQSFTDMASGLGFASSHGLPGYATGVLASKAAALPIIQSLYAHGMQGVVAPEAEALSRASPILQSLFLNQSENSK